MPLELVSNACVSAEPSASSYTWTNISLPGGRLFFCIGHQAGSVRTVSNISHTALSNVTSHLQTSGATYGTSAVGIAVFSADSAGGTANLTVTWSGSVGRGFVQTVRAVDLGAIEALVEQNATTVASLSITGTGSSVAAGFAACVAWLSASASLTGSPWDDLTNEQVPNSFRRQRLVGENGDVSGQTVTFSAGSATLNATSAVLVLLRSATTAQPGTAAVVFGTGIPGV